MSTGWPYKQGTKFKDVTDVFTEVVIGEFADHDKQQGAAIDHSIATGEPLFTPRYVIPVDSNGHYGLPMLVGGQIQRFDWQELPDDGFIERYFCDWTSDETGEDA